MKKKIKRIHISSIPLSLSLGVVLGLACHVFSHFSVPSSGLIAFIFFFSTLNAFIFRHIGRIFFAFCAGFLLAVLRYQNITLAKQFLEESRGKELNFSVKVSSNISSKDGTWRFDATNVAVDGQKLDCRLYVSISDKEPKPKRGDRLVVQGKVLDGFGKYQAYLPRAVVIDSSEPYPPDFSLRLRDSFSMIFAQSIGAEYPEETALGLGYLTGQKDSMPDSLNEKLRRAGLAHVVVASGFHLGLITGLFRKLFKKVSRFASYFAAILAMLAFVSIAGFSSSMLRASLVTLLGMLVGYRGRKLHPARLLLYAAAITLLYSPTLWLDAAWQLSFASYAGLLFLAPLIQDYFFGKDIGSISSSLIQTISAQLACLPISIYVFGSFSPIGIVSNLLIPPTIPLAMLLCFLTVLFSPLSKIGPLIAWLTRRLLGIHVGIVNYLSHFDWASQTVENNNPKVFALYALLILVFLFLKWRSKYSFRPKYGNLTAMEKSRKDVKIYAC